jgi:hypothetical protein
MTPEIITAISKTLNRVFGDDFEIYFSKDVQQGLTEPCFFIAHVGSSRIRRIGQRYYQPNSFDVQYFPAIKRGNTEMLEVAEQLSDALEFVRLADGDLVQGTAMNYTVQDGVLNFFVDFNVFLKKEVLLDEMETLTVDADTTKEG